MDRKMEKVSVKYDNERGGEIVYVESGKEYRCEIPPGRQAVFTHSAGTAQRECYQVTFYLSRD